MPTNQTRKRPAYVNTMASYVTSQFTEFQRILPVIPTLAFREAWSKLVQQFPGDDFASSQCAQEILRAAMSERLSVFASHAQKYDRLWSMMLLRAATAFIEDRLRLIQPALTHGDQCGVRAMLTLAFQQYCPTAETAPPDPIVEVNVRAVVPIYELDLTHIINAVDCILFLHSVEKLHRQVGRGFRLRKMEPDLLAVEIAENCERALALYDQRVNDGYTRFGLVADAVGYDPQPTKESLLIYVPYVQSIHTQLAAHYDAVVGLAPDEQNQFQFLPVLKPYAELQSILGTVSDHAPNILGEVTAAEVCCAIQCIDRIGRRAFFEPSVRPYLIGFGMLPLWQDELVQALTVRIGCDAQRASKVLDFLLQQFDPQLKSNGENILDAAACLRHMTCSCGLFRADSSGLLFVDFCFFAEGVAHWIQNTVSRRDGRIVNARGRHWYEPFVHEAAREMMSRIAPENSEVFPGTVDVGITDIDVLFRWNDVLFVGQCKHRLVHQAVFTADAETVTSRMGGLLRDLTSWDAKVRKVFGDGRWAGFEHLRALASRCTIAIPLLITPRPEFLDRLSPELAMRDGMWQPAKRAIGEVSRGGTWVELPIPRICTLADIERLVQAGGPTIEPRPWKIGIPPAGR